ncbi:hypothetical protein PBRA_005377 [Plasmodiophora brassicae]|uniref:chitin synthase n=1 Tax=Plasmodiophora brassicae TaxID=37360 RepID=A0A0G4IN85_PLABS|nr:hypothetical protein PBRA_005377 [Plasmodiophora brassicae]
MVVGIADGRAGSAHSTMTMVIDPLAVRYVPVPGRPFDPVKPSETCTRYTPVCGPAESFNGSYLLNSTLKRRTIDTMVAVTMYNEEPKDLERTLKGLCRNLDAFVGQLGEHAWRRFQVVIVSDGRRQCHPKTLEYLQLLGAFNQAVMDDALEASTDITMHLFETTAILSDSLTAYHNPLQIVFVLKEDNGGKLDSHRWFFNALAAQVRPTYTFLVDVGTKPDPTAVWKLYEEMESDERIGGCCGAIGTIGSVHVNPFVAAQHFEYIVSTVLDKAMESVFGFISVLPGAFSAYRYSAIEGKPLATYFKLLESDLGDLGPFQGNLYLAEDRILCFEVLAKKDCAWKLSYVKGATASTDVPDRLTSLIKQRRRWLNGSLFATVGVLHNLPKFLHESSHNLFRKVAICLLFAFYAGSTALSWFLMANFYLMFVFASDQVSDLFTALGTMLLTIVQLVIGLGNKPDQMEYMYFLCTIGYGVFFFVTLGMSIQYLVGQSHAVYLSQQQYNLESKVAAVITVSVYLVGAFLHGELFPVVCSMIQYFFMLPTFLIAFPIYSFCNIHDISWGTKGLETAQERVVRATNRAEREAAERKMEQRHQHVQQTNTRFRTFRSYLVIAWVGSNVAFIGLVSTFGLNTTMYFTVTFYVFGFFNVFRFVFSLIYIVKYRLVQCCRRRRLPAHDAARLSA